jgi:23S rRNA (adenine2030-N6)-methyltransferase
MPASRSRYAPDAAPDYSHRFHAGNVGDVWKHLVLVEVLSRVGAGRPGRIVYLESHAGEGSYVLGPTGEWSEGIGRLWARADTEPGPIASYVSLVRRLGEGSDRPLHYPGSPALAAAILGRGARLELWEREPTTYERLRAHMAADPRAEVIQGDGMAALERALRAAAGAADAVVALVDPPYGEKADWRRVPDAIVRAARVAPRTCLLLWYPVKSLTRPHAMAAQLEAAGVEGTLAELITTPLEQKRHRLNGSGVLLIRPPAGALEAIAGAAAPLARLCATVPGVWTLRLRAWGAR